MSIYNRRRRVRCSSGNFLNWIIKKCWVRFFKFLIVNSFYCNWEVGLFIRNPIISNQSKGTYFILCRLSFCDKITHDVRYDGRSFKSFCDNSNWYLQFSVFSRQRFWRLIESMVFPIINIQAFSKVFRVSSRKANFSFRKLITAQKNFKLLWHQKIFGSYSVLN